MTTIILNNKDAAGQNHEIRKALVIAMAGAGWKLRDDGTPVDIDLSVLEHRGEINKETPSWFINGDEVWRWEVFNAARPELERAGDGKKIHCIDLAVELLGEGTVEARIVSALGLNVFGFRTDDIFEHRRVSKRLLAKKMRECAGPWVAYKTRAVTGEGIRMLYRYDEGRGFYYYIGGEDMLCLCRTIDSDRVLAADCTGIDREIVTHSKTPVKTKIYSDKVVVRGKRLLDLRTMTTTECDESVFVTSGLNARWDETEEDVKRTYASEGGQWALKLLNGIEDPKDRKVLLQFWAYTLTPGFHPKKFLILYGGSNCGKSTYMFAWLSVCCEEMWTTFSPSDAFGGGDGKRFGMEGLIGKRIAYCDEWGAYRMSDEGPLKSVVDGRAVDIDLKGQPRRKFQPECKLMASSNNIPSMQDNGGAIYKRILILDLSQNVSFDPDTAAEFREWYTNEDFCTVLLREAVKALNDPEDNCWECTAGQWYVARLGQPSEKSEELRKKIRTESVRCLDVIAAMLTGGDTRTQVSDMLGVQWGDVESEYKDLYKRIHGSTARETGIDYLNSVLIGTTIGGKRYQISKSGSFRLPGDINVTQRGLFHEYSRNRNENGDNTRKAGLWHIYHIDCEDNESKFREELEKIGVSDVYFEECLADAFKIKAETTRLKTEHDLDIEVG